ILFADAAGFSRLGDDQFPLFHATFMEALGGALAAFRARRPDEVLCLETAGDGLCAILRSLGGAAELALSLRAAARSRPWTEQGLPAHLGLRVALHAGPLTATTNRLTGARGFTGAHLCRGAR